jgi:hypothetical protein
VLQECDFAPSAGRSFVTKEFCRVAYLRWRVMATTASLTPRRGQVGVALSSPRGRRYSPGPGDSCPNSNRSAFHALVNALEVEIRGR